MFRRLGGEEMLFNHVSSFHRRHSDPGRTEMQCQVAGHAKVATAAASQQAGGVYDIGWFEFSLEV